MNEIIEEYFDYYVAEDGGGRLDPAPRDSHGPFSPICKYGTTNNENPILFLVQMAVDALKKNREYFSRFKECFQRHMISTEIEKGLHSRRCGDTFYIGQSHDNIVAMAIGSFVFGDEYAERIYQYGVANRWCFNVQNPGEYDIKHQLQGGDIAICILATGRKPEPWYLLWLSGGMASSSAFNLVDLRIQFLDMVWYKFAWWEKLTLVSGKSINLYRKNKRKSEFYGTRFGYFHPSHPFSRLQLEAS